MESESLLPEEEGVKEQLEPQDPSAATAAPPADLSSSNAVVVESQTPGDHLPPSKESLSPPLPGEQLKESLPPVPAVKPKERWELPPDKWFDYQPSCGNVVADTRLVPCKTPLDVKFGLEKEQQFTPEDLITFLAARGQKLGAVIDLTNTARYYNRKDFENTGILYEKINCKGHEVPSEAVVSRFISIVNKFQSQTEEAKSLIAVHCTHGVNRTGYLIGRFLVDVKAIVPGKALEMVASARTHGIERETYIRDLESRVPGKYDPSQEIPWRLHSDRFDSSRRSHQAPNPWERHHSTDSYFHRDSRPSSDSAYPPHPYANPLPHEFDPRHRPRDFDPRYPPQYLPSPSHHPYPQHPYSQQQQQLHHYPQHFPQGYQLPPYQHYPHPEFQHPQAQFQPRLHLHHHHPRQPSNNGGRPPWDNRSNQSRGQGGKMPQERSNSYSPY